MCEVSELLTKNHALDIIEKVVGFPKPQPRFLSWYFRECDGLYTPLVNFQTLAKEIKEQGMIKKMGAVLHFDRTSRERQAVMVAIYNIIRKHDLSTDIKKDGSEQ